MSLPKDDVTVEIAPGADPFADPSAWDSDWVSLTDPEPPDYPNGRAQRPVSISVGRQSEDGTGGPASGSLDVRNEDGALTADNPLGPWFGDLAENTPLRVRRDSNVRFLGLLSELPTTWLSKVENSRVPMRANGVLRRLGLAGETLESALRRHVPGQPDVIAYWPMEDAGGATLASPMPGVSPIRVFGQAEFASVNGPPGSKALPSFRPGGSFTGAIPDPEILDDWRMDWVYRMDDVVAAPRTVGRLVVRTGLEYTVRIDEDDLHLLVRSDEGNTLLDATEARHPLLIGQPVRMSLVAVDDGSDVDLTLTASVGGTVITQITDTLSNRATSRPARVWMGTLADDISSRMLGHITVSKSAVDPWAVNGLDASEGFTGETAAARIERLCSEESVPVTIVGDAGSSMPMGPQRPGNLVEQLRDCERTDGGILDDQAAVIWYRTRVDMYNQDPAWVIDFCDLGGAPRGTRDDQQLRNDVTVSQPGGSSGRYINEAHRAKRGHFEGSFNANPELALTLETIASWRVHLGTVEGQRWPLIPITINSVRDHLRADWHGLRLGDRIVITHDVPQLPGVEIDLLVVGWTEQIHSHRVEITLNCVPASPWRVLELGDDDLGWLHPVGHTLDAGIDDEDTTVDVAVTGLGWTTDGGDYPRDIIVGGEVMTVTAAAAEAGGVQQFTVTRGVNGIAKAHDAGSPVELYPTYVLGM